MITVITLTVMGIFYLRLPATFGLGTYSVRADFVAGGGLYKNANVTYRGVAVGRVESVALNPNGVTARNAAQQRHSDSVERHRHREECVGHRRAVRRPGAAGRVRRRASYATGLGSTGRTPAIGQDVADLLHQAETLVNSLGDTKLRELLHETFIAANGSGPELARLIESARLLVDEANTNYPRSRS